MSLTVGLSATQTHVVDDTDSAESFGSGSLPVFATPRLLAWLEQATCAAVAPALPDGTSTVGSRVVLEHQRPAPIGAVVTCTATLGHVDGRLLRFDVAAMDEADRVLASGEVTRVVIDEARFMSRLVGQA